MNAAARAFDAAFERAAHTRAHFADPHDDARTMAVSRWTNHADPEDSFLFLDRCHGPTLDIGCGPGRLTAALALRGVTSLGVDISRQAVRLTRDRGAVGLCRDVFSPLPGEGRWATALLADGNIGIGADPERLLRRVARIVSPGGTAIVEVDPMVSGIRVETRHIRIGELTSAPFDWALVGADAIADLAASCGWRVQAEHTTASRTAVTLVAASDTSTGSP